MRQFIYQPHHAGLSAWPQGTLRLEGMEITDIPEAADVFVIPGALTAIFRDANDLRRLTYFAGRENRHVAFDCSDNEPLYRLPCLFIRCNTRTWYFQRDPNTVAWPWPVENFAECVEVPDGGFRYDVSFQGWLSSKARRESVECFSRDRGLKCDMAAYSDFCGYIYDTPEGVRRRAEFRRSMRESRIALCPESIPGVLPYRFFEAMSAGRIPLLVGSCYVLPFAEEISYADFTITVESAGAAHVNHAVHEFLSKHSDAEIAERGKLARAMWEKWLDREKWPALMAYAVEKQINARRED